ncbi:hypothetical protein BDW69DRAFT_170797, partial [Aspergillus filifer]
MSLVQSCKSAACGIVSCCDRRSPSKSEQPQSIYKRHPENNVFSKRYFRRLRTWPKDTQMTQQSRANGNRKAVSGRDQQRGNTADKEVEESTEEIRRWIFTYDIVLLGTEPIYRRLLLDFNLNIDAISDEIPTLMNLPITPYNGLEVSLPSGNLAKPVGIVKLKWKLYKKNRKFETTFLVIPNNHFDMLIGRSSIQTHKLWDFDRNIRRRLQY